MGIGAGHRRRWLWPVGGVVALAVVALAVVRTVTAGAGERPAPPATVTVDRGAVTTEVATTGTVEPAQTRSLSFAVSGTVESVRVRAGVLVTPGQELATIDDSDATEAVDAAQEDLADAQDALTRARDAAATTATSCAAPVAYAPSATASPSAGPRPSTSPSVSPSVSPSPGPSPSRSCGTNNGGSGGDAVLSAEQRVNQAEVALADAEDDLDGTSLTAPIAGRILTVAGKVGTQAGSGTAFITLADVAGMQISADFPEADADRLAVRQSAAVTLADRAGATFGATVVQVDPVGTNDGTMVRYGVVLSFDDPPADLLIGQSAGVRVTTGSAEDVLRLPSTAVHAVAGTTATVRRDGAPAQVVIGLRGDQYTEIKSGLAEGAAVVRSW